MSKFFNSSIISQKLSAYIIFLLSCLLFSVIISTSASASIDVYEFENDAQEQQYRRLIDEFRCPKCQNQNLASSDSGISEDLKRKTYQMVKTGKSDTEIRTFMIERYGDFVTYNPPVRPSTYILWYLPPVLLLLAVTGWLVSNRHRKHNRRNHIGNSIVNSDGHEHIKSSNSDKQNTQLTEIEQAKLDSILNQHSRHNQHNESKDSEFRDSEES